MQFADKADGLSVHDHASGAPRMQRRMALGHERRFQREKKSLQIPLDIEKVHVTSSFAPGIVVGIAVGKRCDM